MRTNKIIALIISTIITFLVPVGALAEETKTINEKPVIVEMTLQEAIDYAKIHNKSSKDLKDACDDALSTLDDIKKETQKYQNVTNPQFADSDHNPAITVESQYALWKGYTLANTQQGYDELIKTKELTEQIISYNIEKLTYQIQETQESLLYQKKSKAKAEKDAAIAKLKLKLKMIDKNQVKAVNNILNQINTGIKITNDAYIVQKNALKTLVGVDRKVTLKIKAVANEFKAIGEVNLTELENKAAASRLDAIKLTGSLNTKKMDYEVYEHFKANVAYDEYTDRLDAYNKEKDNYDNAMSDIKVKVETAYEAVLSSEEQYNNAVQAQSIAAENYRVSKLKYKLGMISMVDLMSSELANLKVEQDKNKALDNKVLANRRFAAAYMIGDLETATAQ